MSIKDYKDYDVIDFVEEDYFIKWVIFEEKSHDFFWQAYLREYPHQAEKIEEARHLIIDSRTIFQQGVESIDVPENDFKSQMRSSFEEAKSKFPAKKKSRVIRLRQIAAAACIACIGIFSILFLMSEQNNQLEYVTSHAEWKKVTLPDGSIVELNANTQLSLTDDWESGKDRLVWLKGEAFFKVKKNLSTNAKFTVVTKDLKLEVLGTTFNVNTRNERTEVFLEEGKITLELDEKKEQIEPGEFISYSQEKKEILNRYKKKEEIHSNWKDGVLKLNNASMKDILKEIESIYGIDLIVNNTELLQKEGSVAVPVNDLDMATAILERMLNVKIESKGKQYFVK